MAVDQGRFLDAALGYAELGWRIVPLRERDKRPWLNAWQRNASRDPATIEGWWDEKPTSNVGVQLGAESGIIDIECDSPEAEAALAILLGADPPVTPTFAASRGKHRLFKWRTDLPFADKAVFKFEGVEFRTGNGAKGAQSVFPPSIHPSGAEYKWLVPPEFADVAELPEEVISKLWNRDPMKDAEGRVGKSDDEWKKIYSGVGDGERNQAAAALIGKQLAEMKDVFNNTSVERQWTLILGWNEKNRPPLDEKELRRTFDSVLNLARRNATQLEYREDFEPQAKHGGDGKEAPQAWQLTIVDSSPKSYLLTGPLWRGDVELKTDDMLNAAAIRKQVLEQKEVLIDRAQFDRLWNGTKNAPSLARRLVETAERSVAPLERKRELVVLDLLRDQILKARVLRDNESPQSQERPVKLQNGDCVFRFNGVMREINFSGEKVTREELSRALVRLRADFVSFGKIRFKRLDSKCLALLEDLLSETETHLPNPPCFP